MKICLWCMRLRPCHWSCLYVKDVCMSVSDISGRAHLCSVERHAMLVPWTMDSTQSAEIPPCSRRLELVSYTSAFNLHLPWTVQRSVEDLVCLNKSSWEVQIVFVSISRVHLSQIISLIYVQPFSYVAICRFRWEESFCWRHVTWWTSCTRHIVSAAATGRYCWQLSTVASQFWQV